jgi:hypothetical protein
VPEPAPEPAPPPKPAGGKFTFSGAQKVVLKSPTTGQSYTAGQTVPPGSYKAIVDGVDGGTEVRISEGSTVRLKCMSGMNICKPQ